MDRLVRCRRNTNSVLRVKQLFTVLENVIFCYGVYVVDRDPRSDRLSVPQHPVCDRMVFAPQVTAHVPGNDPVSELPPLSRLVEVLVQPSVKPKGISPPLPRAAVNTPASPRMSAGCKVPCSFSCKQLQYLAECNSPRQYPESIQHGRTYSVFRMLPQVYGHHEDCKTA